jgi:hypothetical protein
MPLARRGCFAEGGSTPEKAGRGRLPAWVSRCEPLELPDHSMTQPGRRIAPTPFRMLRLPLSAPEFSPDSPGQTHDAVAADQRSPDAVPIGLRRFTARELLFG